MRFDKVAIVGLGYDIPPNVLTSLEIEERLGPLYRRLGLSSGRLELMSGIRERRYWSLGARPSHVAARAGRRAIEAGGLDPRRIGCLIYAGICRDAVEPATANFVHARLGLSPECTVFDMSNACLGVVNAMMVIGGWIETGVIDAGLVVTGENGLPLVEATIDTLNGDLTLTRETVKPHFASLTVGSAAVAVLLARADLAPDGHRLRSGIGRTDTRHHSLCVARPERVKTDAGSTLRELMRTDSEGLLAAGVALAHEAWPALRPYLGFDRRAPDFTVTHQVGRAQDKAFFEALGLDPDRSLRTYPWLGNTGTAALPVTLALAAEGGCLSPGDEVALVGIGSGLSCLIARVTW